MSKIELNKIYNSSQIIENNGKWTDFEGLQGSEVELFLKDKMEDAVVDFEYHATGYEIPDTKEIMNNVLVGKNAFGRPVCYQRVINADPTYTASFQFQNVTIGSSIYNYGTSYGAIQVNKSDTLTASTAFKFILTGNIAGSEFNETSAQSVTFKWFKDQQGLEVDATLDTLTKTITPGESVFVDVTKMYENAFSSRYLGMVFRTPKSDVEQVMIFDSPFTLRKLELSYKGLALINTPILTNINLDGTAGEDLSTYRLEYYVDNTTRQTVQIDGSSMTSSSIRLDLKNLTEGAHDVFVRAVSSGNLTSNYVQISFIYQKATDSILKNAIAMVSEVPNEIPNCNLSKFFKVVTTANISGDVEIVALKGTTSQVNGINTIEAAKASKYLFKEISLSLLSTDASQSIDYTSYIEVAGNENTSETLKILIKDGNGTTRALNFYQASGSTPSLRTYKTIEIVNPKEGSSHLQYTSGEILGFSQISNGNVWTDLSPNLDSSDGLQLETVLQNTEEVTMTAFKVSPNEGVFNTPKKLLSAGQTPLHNQAFSIEMMFKTYGINDLEDKIMTIGNITLCPKHIFVNHEPDKNSEPHHTVNASRADFRKEVIQHVMITYDPAYKPSTYELLYDKFFTIGSTSYTSSAQAYPCLKFFVNGTINRIISISPSTICSKADFEMQINPSNSNINYYIFRTYDKALSYEEVKKNYTSSMSKLVDKQAYYLDNDILYLSSDFSAGQLDSKKHILNTISLGKCINKFRSVSNPNKVYTDRRVLLMAFPEGVLPPYYGNRKPGENFGTFLVHYPEVKTESGYVPSDYSGRLSPQKMDPEDPKGIVKAQGSSAKKYVFHNTSYSKFYFTPEAKFHDETYEPVKYYKMPGSDIEIEKLVGKVNYASSMQSHKQGATKLFHDAYISSGFDTSWMNGGRKAVLEDDFFYFFVNVPEDKLQTLTWDYFKQEDGTYNFENCYFLGFQTWGSAKGDKPTSGYGDDTPYYLMLEGADNDNPSANFKTPWASLQIWGNYNKGTWSSADTTLIEAPTSNPVDGKNYYHQFAGGTQNAQTKLWTPDYITGLLIKDETIVFDPGTETDTTSDKKADAWDVDFGCTEGDSYYEKGDNPNDKDGENLFFVFEDKAIESVNRFAQFYNLVYTFDFSSLLYLGADVNIDGTSMTIKDADGQPIQLPMNLTGKPAYQYKLLFGADCTIKYGNKTVTPKAGDIYRWEKAWPADVMENSESKWVPGGLYYGTNGWESLNIADICNWYRNAAIGIGTYPAEYAFFAKEEYKNLKTVGYNGDYKYLNTEYILEGRESEEQIREMQACMAEAFKTVLYEFTDVPDITYHQAFIKLVAGTDNRAKNTYFQIVGPIFTDKYTTVAGEEVGLVKVKEGDHKGKVGYIKDNQFFEVTLSGEEVTETENVFTFEELETKSLYYKNTGKGDFKIRLYADDLDTIFKTDNNGQQVKPYYLLEPPYNRDLEELWGDMHSGLFYNIDLTCVDEVKTQLGKLLNYATGNEWPDTHTTKFYDYFFSIQKNIPSIAYNHHSEIYYESVQTLWQDGKGTPFYKVFEGSGEKSWKDFTNNKVYDPVSLSHGSCLEAEIEYLRDRVLLLSTYTNTAKNKTDNSILLNGGSATTQGSEVIISADYTSFIQYIYPIINNIPSAKNYTGMDYDPLLDYMSWNTAESDYNNIGLIYNIAMPNEPLDISVKFASSGLTSNSYWTSTDLYRTIRIKSGTNSFSQLFSFPNASTVISQDPDYKIEISESKEVDVVDYLESIEHLVLQEADITSEGLDFTGCNRLKTLVLGKTEDNLTDSPEDTPIEEIEWYAVKFADVLDPGKVIKVNAAGASTGFRQVILPKSSSVEQVILPNCIEIANINYYPNLQRLEFNTGTELVNLTIDGRNPNHIIEYLLNNFIGTYTTNLEITNIPENFWLTEIACKKLAQISNVKIVGKINIGDGINLAQIDWTTKRMLVEKFGNIDDASKSSITFDYKKQNYDGSKVSVNTTGTIESSGLAPVYLTIIGNNVPIESNGQHVRIKYSIKDKSTGNTPSTSDICFVDAWTPQLIIKENLRGTYIITTEVYPSTGSTAVKLTTEVTVGFYAPKVGDFAYVNGSFSSVCDPSQGIVGVVFYSNQTVVDGKNTYDVRVLSKNYSSTDLPMAPANYAVSSWGSTHSTAIRQKAYESFLNNLGLTKELYYKDAFVTVNPGQIRNSADGTITYDRKQNGVDLYLVALDNVDEHTVQKQYINLANDFINKLNSEAKLNLSVTYIEEYGWSKPTKEGKERFETLMIELNSKTYIDIKTNSYKSTDCGGFTYALFPAFLKALYYSPSNLSGKGETYFGVGNWYIPDSRELERLIYYRINSSISTDSSSEIAWNNTTSSGKDVSGKGLNIFSEDTFANIAYLSDMGSQITSEGSADGAGLAYGKSSWSSSYPQWSSYVYDYEPTMCARDVSHNISPVCRIVLVES